MDLRQFRYFVRIAEERNFTKAASTLNVSQPALSQQVKELEAELGVQLFDRSTRAVRVTEAGELVLEHSRRTLASVEALSEAVEAYRGLRRGRVRVGVIQTFNAFYLPEIVARFIRAYDGIDIEVLELSNADITEALTSGAINLGVGLLTEASPLPAEGLYHDSLAFVCAPPHPLATHASLKLEVLCDECLALLSRGFATRTMVDQILAARGVVPRRIIEFNTFSAILNAVSAGTCVSITPANARRMSPALDLHFGKIKPTPPIRTICLLKGPPGLKTPATTAFEQALMDYFNHGPKDVRN